MPYRDFRMPDFGPMSGRGFEIMLDTLKRQGVSNKKNHEHLPPLPRLRKILEIYGRHQRPRIEFKAWRQSSLVYVEIVGWTPERFAAELAAADAAADAAARKP